MLRVEIRVRPGAAKDLVGGAIGGRLQVRVTAPAIDGRATDAALGVLAEAFGVRRSAVTLLAGATSRDKRVEIQGDVGQLTDRLEVLLQR